MKHFLLSMLLCSSVTILQAALMLHAPAFGELLLGDNGNAAGIQRGVIMDTILNNPDFVNETAVIKEFLGLNITQPINLSYQQIIQLVQQSTNTKLSIAVIEAVEKALMHQYHYDTYATGSYTPWQSIFFTGIKYSWINPIKFINPTYWISDKDPNLNQVMNEMAFLSRVARKHSVITSQRINATIESYLHWKRNIALIVLTYFAADMCKRGLKQSSLHDLYSGGLTSSPIIIKKLANNIYSGTKLVTTTTIKYTNAGYELTKPVINTVLFGMHPTPTKKPTNLKPSQDTRSNNNWWNNTSSTTSKNQPIETIPTLIINYCKDSTSSYMQQVHDHIKTQPIA